MSTVCVKGLIWTKHLYSDVGLYQSVGDSVENRRDVIKKQRLDFASAVRP